ncbi:MAG: TRAP transporter permease, partial [Clostridium sp.]|nr:TRAP transporter permease [Clostridium sp.]
AGVARCNPTKTGVFAFKLSLSGFILPFMFVYNPVLLMQGGALEILQSLITALLGIYSLSSALEKFVFKWNINQAERLVLLASALLLIVPGTVTDLIGFAVLLGIFLLKMAEDKKRNYAKA